MSEIEINDALKFIKNDSILLDKQIIKLLETILSDSNIGDIKVLKTDLTLLARYSRDNNIYLNPERLIAYSYIDITINKNIKNKIKGINYRILQILLHEIEHVIQFEEYNDFFELCEKRENFYKINGKYGKKEYLCNPLERSAEIFSNSILFKKISMNEDEDFLTDTSNQIYNLQNYGYYSDEYCYPMNYFFDKNIPCHSKKYNNMIFGDIISLEEYNKFIKGYRRIK